MTTDYRALCAELLCSLEQYPVQPPRDRDLIDRARAALAQPEPQGASDEDLIRMAENAGFAYENDGGLFNSHIDSFDIKLEVLSFARAVLARWGNR
jgi:hypothetical protein